MTDFVQVPPDSTGKQIATNVVGGKHFQTVMVADDAGAVVSPLTDAELRATPLDVSISGSIPVTIASAIEITNDAGNPIPVSGTVTANTGLTQPLTDAQLRATAVPVSGTVSVTGVATEATLAAMSAKLSTASTTMPLDTTPATPVRQAPLKFVETSYAYVGSGIDTTEEQLIATGSGQAISRSAGNLVITSGTTANSETVIRSLFPVNGALTFKSVNTLSQRIANNNFFVELVDVIGDGLSYTIVNTTTVNVTKTAHGLTAANVGQRMDICAITGAAGIPMEGVIASIPDANTIQFTVAGWPASGSGTCSLTGWNKVELRFDSTVATGVQFNTRRNGWQNGGVLATINTTASGVMTSLNVNNGLVSLSDQAITSAVGLVNRNAWVTNIPEPSVTMYYQLRCKNGTAAPASTTTWTIGMNRIEDYIPTQVELVGTRQQSINNSIPVTVLSGSTTAVTGTVTATVTGGTVLPVTPTTTFTNSAATTNATNIKATAGTVWSIVASNANAAARYVKFYNLTTAPTVGTSVPTFTIAIPANGTVQIDGGANGIRFGTGIALAITTGVADSDTTAVAANEIKVATTFT